MPRWTAIYVVSSFVYLLLGGAWGAWMLATKGQAMGGVPWVYRAWHVESMLFGWLTQFIWGIGFWIFPRFWTARPRSELIPWVWALLNGGLVLGIWGVFARNVGLRFVGHVGLLAAAVLFTRHAWPRIKPPGA